MLFLYQMEAKIGLKTSYLNLPTYLSDYFPVLRYTNKSHGLLDEPLHGQTHRTTCQYWGSFFFEYYYFYWISNLRNLYMLFLVLLRTSITIAVIGLSNPHTVSLTGSDLVTASDDDDDQLISRTQPHGFMWANIKIEYVLCWWNERISDDDIMTDSRGMYKYVLYN